MIAPNETGAGTERVRIGTIETLCASYDDACTVLDDSIAALEADLETVKQKHLRTLKRQVAVAAAIEAELHGAVQRGPELFKKPRTLTFHGVKVGYAVSAGKLQFDDADTVVKLLRTHLGKTAGDYIRTSEEPNKDALKTLEADVLKRVGCEVTGAGDVVVLKRTAGDVEKMVTKLLDKLVEAMVETE